MGTETTPKRRRRIPWELILIVALAAVAVGLITFALLPPAPPPYIT